MPVLIHMWYHPTGCLSDLHSRDTFLPKTICIMSKEPSAVVRFLDTNRPHDMHHLLDEVKCSDLESERADMLIERGLYIQLAESADLRRGVLLILARAMDPVSKTTTLGSLSNFLDGTMCSPYKEAKYSAQKVNLILYIAEQILDNGVEGGYTKTNQTW
jgi:hypothetical protein